jgi:hypothetical protein
MKELYFKCAITSDVVLNSSLATEGNLSSLDYIPGSNFLGIVASKLYNNTLNKEVAFDLFHSGKVKFGDATIFDDFNGISYPMPFAFFNDKKSTSESLEFYLHHLVYNSPPSINGNSIQLKQERQGFLFVNNNIKKGIEKSYRLKSAQDRETRSSKDGQIFGFESITKGQDFLFSIQFENDAFVDTVKEALIGNQRIGKSKSAEFGQVTISEVNVTHEISSFESNKEEEQTLVYAQSNLCFLDMNGSPSYQPTVQDLGFDSGMIIWEKSQIRTCSYSPWNFKRNTYSTERHCIAKGSVFCITSKTKKSRNTVGYYQSEGLGRVIYNPAFLKEGTDNKTASTFSYVEKLKNLPDDTQRKEIESNLGRFLNSKVQQKSLELEISKKVNELVNNEAKKYENLKKINSSQWGTIRAYASKAESIEILRQQLFGDDKDEGYLTHGVANLKFWAANKEVNLILFKSIFNDNKKLGQAFIEKFAAEMAKISKRKAEK